MRRGALVIDPPEATLLVQRGLTVAASGYNAFYFATYRLRNGRHGPGADHGRPASGGVADHGHADPTPKDEEKIEERRGNS